MGYNDQQNKKTESKFRKYLKRKKWLVTCIVVLVVAVGAYIVFVYMVNNKTDKSNDNRSISSQVDALVVEKGPVAGQKFLDSKIQNTNVAEEKAKLYVNKSVLASSRAGGRDNSLALGYAYDAERITPSENTALVIASLEEKLGNISNAIKYYKIYLGRLPADAKGSPSSDYDYYANRVIDLEARLKK